MDKAAKATGEEWAKPPLQEFVVMALEIKDTAVLSAESQEEAIEKYELPEELSGLDVVLWAVTKEEFDDQVAAAAIEAGAEIGA